MTSRNSCMLRAGLRQGQIFLIINVLAWAVPLSGCQGKPSGSLVIAFPKSVNELRLIFSEPVDRASAERPESYSTESGLKILGASLDPNDPKRVMLKTEPMPTWETAAATGRYERPNDEPLKIDIVRATGVRTLSGATLAKNESPRFIQGIPSVWQIQTELYR